MKKQKLVVSIAMILCLIMWMQSTTSVEAAPLSARVWTCTKCGEPVTIDVKKNVYWGKREVDCNLQEHKSLLCKIEYDVYADEYWITCDSPKCGVRYRQNADLTYLNGVHSCISQQSQ